MSTVDRTEHVLDAIDGALEDWSVSPDAMRWAPEPEIQPRPSGPRWQPTIVPPDIAIDWRPMTTPPQNGRASWHTPSPPIHYFNPPGSITVYGEAVRSAMEALSRAIEIDEETLEHFMATLADLQPPAVEDAEPETPQARALRMRQQRGTGPARESAGRQKRPRRL